MVIVAAIIGFGSSTRLASAYGVAVSGTMLATTILTFFVIRFGWGYNLLLCIAATGFFILIDMAFFASSVLKIAEGGWFPLALGAIVFTVMTTWRRGRQLAMARQKQTGTPLESFLDSLAERPPHRVAGTAIFMAGNADALSRALLQNLECNKVLHERVVLLTIVIRDYPWVASSERIEVEPLGHGFYRLMIYFGFIDRPDVSQALDLCEPARTGVGPAAHLVPAQPRDGHSHGQEGHGAVARTAVRRHGTQCAHRRRLLQHPDKPGDRARHEDRDLTTSPPLDETCRVRGHSGNT